MGPWFPQKLGVWRSKNSINSVVANNILMSDVFEEQNSFSKNIWLLGWNRFFPFFRFGWQTFWASRGLFLSHRHNAKYYRQNEEAMVPAEVTEMSIKRLFMRADREEKQPFLDNHLLAKWLEFMYNISKT